MDMKKFLIELLIIFPIALILFIPLSVVGILYTFFKHIIRLDYSFKRQAFPILRSFNLALDGFANASSGELLNDFMKVRIIRYGKWYQTISAVTGLRYLYEGINSKLRKVLNKLEKNHCEISITKEDRFYWDKNFDKIRDKFNG